MTSLTNCPTHIKTTEKDESKEKIIKLKMKNLTRKYFHCKKIPKCNKANQKKRMMERNFNILSMIQITDSQTRKQMKVIMMMKMRRDRKYERKF